MPGTIVSDVISMKHQAETITVMDDYGNLVSVNVGIAQIASRDSLLSDALAAIKTNEAAFAAFCTSMSVPPPTPLTDVEKASAWTQMQAGTYVAPVLTVPAAAPALAKS